MHQRLCPHTLRHQQRCLYSRTLGMYQMNAHLLLFCAMAVPFLGGRKYSWFLCVADSQTTWFRQIFFESRDFLIITVLDTHHALNELLPFLQDSLLFERKLSILFWRSITPIFHPLFWGHGVLLYYMRAKVRKHCVAKPWRWTQLQWATYRNLTFYSKIWYFEK